MAALLTARILETALHFTILGGLTDVALQLHDVKMHDAITHAVVASACILILAVATYFAKSLLGKNSDDFRLNVTWARTRKKPRSRTPKKPSGDTPDREES